MRVALIVLFSFILSLKGAHAFDFSEWDALLKDHVYHGRIEGITTTVVDYRAMGGDKRFSSLISALKRFNPDTLKNREEILSFWINVYNIFAIKIVVENYPVESIKDVGGVFRSVWKMEAGRVGGRAYSLDEIEHGILRKLGEPRVHFAIVCASLSCPDLRKEAYRAELLYSQLDESTQRFLANPTKGLRVDKEGRTVYVSSIFKWFREDFVKEGGVLNFLIRYAPQEVRGLIASRRLWMDYMDYNWTLNDLARNEDVL